MAYTFRDQKGSDLIPAEVDANFRMQIPKTGSVFNGVLNFADYNVSFANYATAGSITLSAGANPLPLSVNKVLIKGGITINLPTTWSRRGGSFSTDATQWNEIYVQYEAGYITLLNTILDANFQPVDVAVPTSPTVPSNLATPIIGDTSITLSWDASTSEDSFVWDYKIYKDNVYLKVVPQSDLSSVISNLVASTQYSFTVSAIDDSGRESEQSEPVLVTTNTSIATSATPSEVNMEVWYDATDSLNKEIQEVDKVVRWRNKIGDLQEITGSTAGSSPILYSSEMSFPSGKKLSGAGLSILTSTNDYHVFCKFKINTDSSLPNRMISNGLSSTNAFSIYHGTGTLAVGFYNGSFTTKGTALTDITGYHVVEIKKTGGVIYAELDGVEMTGESPTFYRTTNPNLYMGDPVGSSNDFSLKCFAAKSIHLTPGERDSLLSYLNNI